ncbi:MAG TPA: hypothetical protein PKX23_18670 [Verrucomicrobiota bacterium]|nr:hypothetical protein [Verrucomicrobiota bacterium]HRT09605.1 hypothetical protein [Candidatus Paceibacterota bacterium]
MDTPAADPLPASTRARLLNGWGVFALAVAVGCLAISNRSFWIDETLSALKALMPTLGDWWRGMVQEKASDLQMPLYMVYLWGWEKLFGSGEWALRAANLPWFGAGVAWFVLAFPRGGQRGLALLVALFSSMAWYYLDEARPYTMQLSGALLIAGSLLRRGAAAQSREERQGDLVFLVGLVILSGSSLLGMIFAAGGLGLFILLAGVQETLRRVRQSAAAWGVAGVLLLLLGVYYCWSVAIGARASAGATTSLKTTAFVFYELLGFGGLGPGRLELRHGGLGAFGGVWGWVGAYAAVLGVVLAAGLIELLDWRVSKEPGNQTTCRGGGWKPWLAGAISLIPAVLILAAGLAMHFRVLGRHLMPLLPLIWVVFLAGLRRLWERGGGLGKGISVAFLALNVMSCLTLRWADRHAKDDYRSAAAYAQEALRSGRSVWWNAAEQGAIYYRVPLGPGGAEFLMNPTPGDLEGRSRPDVVIASKPDVYDVQGSLAQWLAAGGYVSVRRWPAFEVWERKIR